jgi:hypothetical protein
MTVEVYVAPHQVRADESLGLTQSQDMAKNTRPVLTFLATAPKRKSIAVWE